MPYAHPTVEHFAPLFVALGAATEPGEAPTFTIEGYWLGLAKRSFQFAEKVGLGPGPRHDFVLSAAAPGLRRRPATRPPTRGRP